MSCKPQKDIDCLILGYAGVDRIIRIQEPAEKGKTSRILNADNRNVTFGGNGSNVAACMARLGCRVVPVMRVGRDWEELGYRRMLTEYGVELSGITVVPDETTSICHLVEDAEGNHLTMTYPGAMDERYAPESLDEALFERARYSLVTVATRTDVERFVDMSERHALPLILGVRIDLQSFPLPIFTRLLMNSELIFMNEAERAFIEREIAPLPELFGRGRAKQIVVTLGERGSTVYERTGSAIAQVSVSAVGCSRLVDATGAGDSYIAGYLYGYLRGCDARTCAVYGSCEASFIIERVGCTDGAPDHTRLLERVRLHNV